MTLLCEGRRCPDEERSGGVPGSGKSLLNWIRSGREVRADLQTTRLRSSLRRMPRSVGCSRGFNLQKSKHYA